jgi:2'-5' RNA ligase
MPRVFFALWPDDAQRDELCYAAKSVQPKIGGRLMRRENLHQTLVFIGNIADEKLPTVKATAASNAVPGFTLEFGTLRYWRHNRIVWAAPISIPEPLLELVTALEARLDAAGIEYDKRAYQPHITLVREGRSPGELPPLNFDWPVRDFTLVESAREARGVVYRVIARWPLAA